MPNGARKPCKVFTCCCARISVGAMKALWYPARCAAHKSAAATSVLPLPTSPCKRRDIRLPDAISRSASSAARRCALVGEKGRAA